MTFFFLFFFFKTVSRKTLFFELTKEKKSDWTEGVDELHTCLWALSSETGSVKECVGSGQQWAA